ncbi:MAG: DUF6383 domain-containing protein [Muribaculaceae bacterium]
MPLNSPTSPQGMPHIGLDFCCTDLAAFKDARYIRVEIALRAIHNTDELTWSVPVDNIRVLYSTTDVRPESFIEVDAVENYPADGVVPEEWTEFKAALPAGAKYFAINHDAYDTYALMVDDIAFEAAGAMPADAAIVGYNVFRNGVKVNQQPVAQTAYADAVPQTGTYNYCVSTVYSCGESKACAPIEIVVDDISAADAVAAGRITIVAGKGTIEVRGAQGRQLTVANAAGALCHSAIAADHSRISLPAGIYLVEVGGKVAKVIVR